MMHAPGRILAQQKFLCGLMADEIRAPARMVIAFARIFRFLAHVTPARGATRRQMSCATVS